MQQYESSTTTDKSHSAMPDLRCEVAVLYAEEPCAAYEPLKFAGTHHFCCGCSAITSLGKTAALVLCCSTYTARDSVFEASYDGPDNT